MKVFTHGSMVNFQESAREMILVDLQQLVNHYMEGLKKILFGTIYLGKGEIHSFGTLLEVSLTEQKAYFQFKTADEKKREVSHHTDHLEITHDAVFTIMDEEKGQVEYQVIYLTFEPGESEEEVTYYLAVEEKVSHPLACVAEFWQHVSQVGRDVDFSVVGCRAKVFCKRE